MQAFKTIITSVCVAAGLLIGQTPAFAQGAEVAFGGLQHDSSLPIEITSNELSVDQATGKAIFSGDVLIGQGALRLSSTTVEVIYGATDNTEISKLIATGDVMFLNDSEAIEAQRAEYDIKAATIALSGNVILTQGANALSGQSMIVDLSTGTGRIEGRVKTILQPGTQ